jgi:RNA polymerase sigma-70 factor (ECF subfamily)
MNNTRKQAGRSSAVEDQALLLRIAASDQEALRQFYTMHHGRLRRFLARHLCGDALIDEVINDTMMVVWCRAGDFRGESRVTTWMTGIAHRCALNALRRAATCRRREREAGERQRLEQEDSFDPSHRLHEAAWLDAAMRQLRPERREAVTLAYFAGDSCAEIARIQGAPVNTVKARLFKGRGQLRALLPALA